MILTLPLWLLRGVSVVLLVGCVVLVVALLVLGRLREARTLRDLAGLQKASLRCASVRSTRCAAAPPASTSCWCCACPAT